MSIEGLARFLLLALAVAPVSAAADLIASVELGEFRTAVNEETNFRLAVYDPAGGGISNYLWGPSTIDVTPGSVFSFDGSSDPIDFPAVAARLINGVDEMILVEMGSRGGFDAWPRWESGWIAGPNGIDLGGYVVERLDYAFSADYHVIPLIDGVAPIGEGSWGFRIYGSPVPEPSSALLLSLGLSTLSWRRGDAR